MKVESESEVTQSCLTLCNPMDCSPPGSSIHGIFQATVLEWGARAFSLYWNIVALQFCVSFYCTAKWISHTHTCVCVLNCFSHVWFFATPWTTARQAPLSMGFFLTRILEWVAMPSSRESSWRLNPRLLCLLPLRRILYHWTTGEACIYIYPLFFWIYFPFRSPKTIE